MRLSKILMFSIFFCVLPIQAIFATEQKNIFAEPKNLKVLSEDISSKELGDTMKSFALGLGLRCNNCHVGEPGKPLSTYDFASDDKPLKHKARIMLQMVQELNNTMIKKLDTIEKAPRVKVQCTTCHRGQSKPQLIEQVLADKMDEGGIELLLQTYTKLRSQYYGSHTYDFSENVLPMFSRQYFSKTGHQVAAVKLLEANINYFPESYFGHFSLGAAYQAIGDNEKATAAYQKALQLNPRAVFLQKRIKSLSK